MKKIFGFFIFFALFFFQISHVEAVCQNKNILVLDEKKEKLPGCTVIVNFGNEKVENFLTDTHGEVNIPNFEKEVLIIFNYPGYKKLERKFTKNELCKSQIIKLEKQKGYSLIALISDPLKFDGRFLETCGYFVFESGNSSLWVNPIDSEVKNLKNGISIMISGKEKIEFFKFNRKFCCAAGIFSSYEDSLGWYSGSLSQIEKFESL